MRKAYRLAAALYKARFARLLDAWWGPERLTVLAYHRIIDATDSAFDHYQANVSASPEMFARQMAYVAEHFNVIDLATLHAHLQNGSRLPPRPLLITFDDGYLDNYQNAYPVLRRYGLPAVIFLMTSRMDDTARLAWWDEVAYVLHHTQQQEAELPLMGHADLSTPARRSEVRESLTRALKTIPEDEKLKAIETLRATLAVELPQAPPVFLNWDQVRELVANGVACQPHTVTHPILTRCDPEQMRRELRESRDRIREETGQAIWAFAYPNGMPGDYDGTTLAALRELGYALAFTLTPGPVRLRAVRQHPLEIERVFVFYRDTFEAFVMNVMGLSALLGRLRSY